MISDLINRALIFSSKAHRSQLRKSTDIPYISHPAAVGMILIKAGCRDELVAAGILHDCLEDSDVTEKDILSEFGPEVLKLVKGASEPEHRSKSWKERKQHTIEYLKSAPPDIKMVSCADKLHNVMCIFSDFKVFGEKVWERFNAPMQSQVWYYSELAKSFQSDDPKDVIFKEFTDRVNDLILEIKIQSKNKELPEHSVWKAHKIQPGKVHAFAVIVKGDEILYECDNFGSLKLAQKFSDWVNAGMKSNLSFMAFLNVARLKRHNLHLPD